MNTYFGRHAIVTLEPNDRFITLRTLDAQHGRSCRMFMDSKRLYCWLDKPTGDSYMDYDCGSFIVMHRYGSVVHVRQTWVQADLQNNLCGYAQNFDLPVDAMFAVLVADVTVRTLAALESRRGQAAITITNGAHRQIKALDKRHRRALSKAMRDNFRWKDSHVCLYADWRNDFAFVDQRMIGGLCLHETKVIGRDGKRHKKLYYQVHT